MSPKTCSKYVTADCTRGKHALQTDRLGADVGAVQYSLPNATSASPGNEMGFFESLGDHYSREDLDHFWKKLYP